MTDCGIVFMTAANHDEAERIARSLLEKRLAACVQIHPEIRSLYWWEGRVCDEAEILFTAKTTRACFDELVAEVKKLHSYSVPEIIFVSIADAPPDYQSWIAEVTK
jgi:periplasmic divalent cation tolerance protein